MVLCLVHPAARMNWSGTAHSWFERRVCVCLWVGVGGHAHAQIVFLLAIPPGLGLGNSSDQLLGVVVRTDSHHGQPPPPPPPPRKPHSHRPHWHNQHHHHHHKGEGTSKLFPKSEVTPKEKFVVEVGIGDRTPPLPGELVSAGVTAPSAAVLAASSSDSEPAKPVITMYRSEDTPEAFPSSGPVEEMEQVSVSAKEEVPCDSMAGSTVEASNKSEEECIISDSSLSPPSSLGEEDEGRVKEGSTEVPDEAMEVGEVTAYSPSAPLEDEPYSPSHDAALEEEVQEEKMDTSRKDESSLELPYSPESAAVEDVESASATHEMGDRISGATEAPRDQPQQGGAFSLVSSFISSQVTAPPLQGNRQPSQSLDAATPTSEQAAPAQNSSAEQSGSNSANLSSAQLQNLLAKLPILAQSILGQSAATPPSTSATPSSPTTSASTTQMTGVGDKSALAPPPQPSSSIPVLEGCTTRTSWAEAPSTRLYNSQGPPHEQFPGLSESEEGAWRDHMGWRQGDPRQQRQEQEGWR